MTSQAEPINYRGPWRRVCSVKMIPFLNSERVGQAYGYGLATWWKPYHKPKGCRCRFKMLCPKRAEGLSVLMTASWSVKAPLTMDRNKTHLFRGGSMCAVLLLKEYSWRISIIYSHKDRGNQASSRPRKVLSSFSFFESPVVVHYSHHKMPA